MKRILNLILVIIIISLFVMLCTSCTAEPIQEQIVRQELSVQVNKENTFTVVWSSNQSNPYVEFNKHTFITCDEHTTITELHRENKFNITLKDNQLFDIYINREESVKNPELYLAIYKGDELQYEKEINSNAYVLMTFVDKNGNIANQESNNY